MAKRIKKTITQAEASVGQGEYAITRIDQQFSEAAMVYVDGINGFAVQPGNIVKLNWVQDKLVSPIPGTFVETPMERHVVLRMVMTLDQFLKIHQWINNAVGEMNEKGLLHQSAQPERN